MSEYIEREAVNALIKAECSPKVAAYLIDAVAAIPAADVRPVPDGGIGEMSDGYHTFNGLYYQRMVLFAALVKQNKGKAWKSWRHEDGELCFGGGWFIVGIDTPEGSYTYHYEDKDWDLFDCVELPVAKHWDGHTGKDVTRLLSLDMPRWIPVTERLPESGERVLACCRVKWLGGGGRTYVCAAFHSAPKTETCVSSDGIDMEYDEETDEYYLPEGWWEVINNWDDYSFVAIGDFVTHWMPLPEPPKEET